MNFLTLTDRILVKKHLIALFILILPFVLSSYDATAQAVSQIRVGEQLSMKGSFIYPGLFRDVYSYYLLSFKNPDFLLCREGIPEFTIETFDTAMKHTESIPVRASLNSYHKLEPIYIDKAQHSFDMFSTETSVATGTSRSIAFRVGPRGEIQGQPVILGEITGLDRSATLLYTAKEDSYFRVARFHEDSSAVFLYTQRYPAQDQPTAKLMVKVLDTAFAVKRSKLLNLAVPPEYSKMSDILLAQGELFFILTVQLPLGGKVFKLVTYNFDQDELSYYDFTMEGKKIHSLETCMLEKGNIVIRGLFADDGSKKEVDGLLYFLFDTDNQTLLSSGSVTIPAARPGSSGDGLEHLQIKETFVRQNGDVVILSELYWTEVIDFTDSEGKLYLRPWYHSDDLLAVYFDKTGNWKWSTWIPREFESGSEEMLGFHSLMTDSVIYIIYNDHPDNLMNYDPGKIKRVKGRWMPLAVTLDLDSGVFRKYSISSGSEIKTDLSFRRGYLFNLPPNEMIWILTEGYLNLVRITFGNAERSSTKKN
ncbi:MAG: hypothetical protein PHD25_09500 [Bacteroidales bacterium]|nr:hypothetical protein [Bacteroidales bacterium]